MTTRSFFTKGVVLAITLLLGGCGPEAFKGLIQAGDISIGSDNKIGSDNSVKIDGLDKITDVIKSGQASSSAETDERNKKLIDDAAKKTAEEVVKAIPTPAPVKEKPSSLKRLFETILKTDGFPVSDTSTVGAKFLAQAVDPEGNLVVWVDMASGSGPYTFVPDAGDLIKSTYVPRTGVRGLDTFTEDVTGTSAVSVQIDTGKRIFVLDPAQNQGLASFPFFLTWDPSEEEKKRAAKRYAVGKGSALFSHDGKRWFMRNRPPESQPDWVVLKKPLVNEIIDSLLYPYKMGNFSARTEGDQIVIIGEEFTSYL